MVSCQAVHAVVTASCDHALRDKVNTFPAGNTGWAAGALGDEPVAPDAAHGKGLSARAGVPLPGSGQAHHSHLPLRRQSRRSPEAANQSLPVFPEALPHIAGSEAPPFRPLTPDEDRASSSGSRRAAQACLYRPGLPQARSFRLRPSGQYQGSPGVCGHRLRFPRGCQEHGSSLDAASWAGMAISVDSGTWPSLAQILATNSMFLAKQAAALARRRQDKGANLNERRSDSGGGRRGLHPGTWWPTCSAGATRTSGPWTSSRSTSGTRSSTRSRTSSPTCKTRTTASTPAAGRAEVYNLAADMGGMGFIENNKGLCMLSVLINTHLLHGGQGDGRRAVFLRQLGLRLQRRQADATPTSSPLQGGGRLPRHARGRLRLGKALLRADVPALPRGLRPGDARSPASTTSTARTAPGRAAARRRRPPICRKVIEAKLEPASTRSKSGATASRPAASCTSTTASRASTPSCTATSRSRSTSAPASWYDQRAGGHRRGHRRHQAEAHVTTSTPPRA